MHTAKYLRFRENFQCDRSVLFCFFISQRLHLCSNHGRDFLFFKEAKNERIFKESKRKGEQKIVFVMLCKFICWQYNFGMHAKTNDQTQTHNLYIHWRLRSHFYNLSIFFAGLALVLLLLLLSTNSVLIQSLVGLDYSHE